MIVGVLGRVDYHGHLGTMRSASSWEGGREGRVNGDVCCPVLVPPFLVLTRGLCTKTGSLVQLALRPLVVNCGNFRECFSARDTSPLHSVRIST